MNHTPTPGDWTASPYEDNRGQSQITSDGSTRIIAVLDTFDEEGKANAEFIVRACNSHDALLEACREAALWLRDEYPSALPVEMLEAAVAKAAK